MGIDTLTIQPAQNNFGQIIDKTLSYEGSAFNPKDPSKFGVLQTTYQKYLTDNNKPLKTVDRITLPEAQDIYHKDYYLKNSLDKLPERLSAVTFDYAVHSGSGTAIKALQKLVGTEIDGKMGPHTLAAIDRFVKINGEDVLIEGLINHRREYIERLIKRNPNLPAQGLRNRVDKVEHDWLRINSGIRNLKR